MNKHIEDNTHQAVCNYIRLQYPKVIFNTDLSGVKLSIWQAAKVNKLRSSKGFPDIVIYEPRNNYHGLFIELKHSGVKLFKKDGSLLKNNHVLEQIEMINKLKKRGYAAYMAVGFDEAKEIIDKYLKI